MITIVLGNTEHQRSIEVGAQLLSRQLLVHVPNEGDPDIANGGDYFVLNRNAAWTPEDVTCLMNDEVSP